MSAAAFWSGCPDVPEPDTITDTDLAPAPVREPDSQSTDLGWVLSGFDSEGRKVRMQVTEEELVDAPDGLFIGRGPDCHKRVKDNSVSRVHAQLTVEGGELVVVDLGSTNGTFVNGEQIEPETPVVLQRGTQIEFGDARLTVNRG